MNSNDWKEVQLGELCTLITDGSHTSPPSVEKGYYMASVKDMDTYRFNFENCRMISELDYKILAKNGCKPQYGDVLIGKDGARYLEDVFIFRQAEDVVLLSSIAILRPDNLKVLSQFLYYFLSDKNTKNLIKSNFGSGSAIPRIVLKDFKKVPILVPLIQKQTSITSILSTLDDKIEFNNRMNRVLNRMAQAIFKQWFVDFEFPNEYGEPYKSSGGVMIICEEMGKDIPIGWKVSRLKEQCELITKGTTPTTLGKKFKDSGIKFIKAESITDDHSFNSNKFAFIDEETNLLLKRSILKEDDMLFTIAGTLGRFAIVSSELLPANTNQAVCIIRVKKTSVSPHFLLCYFLSGEQNEYYASRTQQAVQANLSLTTIGDMPLIIPSFECLKHFNRTFDELLNKSNYSAL